MSVYACIYCTPGLIRHSAHDHLGHHNDTIESDPCHIAIFHPGLEGSCDHKYHLTQGHEDCPLCQISFLHQIQVEEFRCLFDKNIEISSVHFTSEHDVKDYIILHSARGPPAYVIS